MAGSHKRETNARFVPKAAFVAAPAAVLATTSAVAFGVTQASPSKPAPTVIQAKAPSADLLSLTSGRTAVVSRSSLRLARSEKKAQKVQIKQRIQSQDRARALEATAQAVADADTKMWTTAELNVWTAPGGDARQVGALEKGAKVTVTGRKDGDRAEIVLNNQSRWVTAGHFSAEEPVAGIGGECTNGTSVASWVSPRIKAIHESVCARFPSIQVYGTRTGAGDHGTGRAVDIMLSGPIGWEVAEYLKENWQAFGISYLIYEQKIWSVERGGEGWRGMSSRGSITANHYDHVHVSVY